MSFLISVLLVITRRLNCTFPGKVPFFPALITCRRPLSTFSRVILPALPADRVSCVVLLRGWLASIFVRLTVPLSLVVLVLPLRLTSLLASILWRPGFVNIIITRLRR